MAAGDIGGKVVADLGAGTGVLSVGACLLGAELVYAVEFDEEAVEVLRRNASAMNLLDRIVIVRGDVSDFHERVDTVIMNPPFGAQRPHSDRPFLSKAFEVAGTVYSIHLAKPEVRKFIREFSLQHGFRITDVRTMDFEIPATFKFHRKRIERIKVDLYRFEPASASTSASAYGAP